MISSSADPFSRYYAEILRAEGLNAFTATDISLVTSTLLTGYDVVILGEMPLTDDAGHDVQRLGVRRRQPDRHAARQEAGLTAGLDRRSGDAVGRLPAGQYRSRPGAGIVNQTMQFHGMADRYIAERRHVGSHAVFDRGRRDDATRP